MAEPGITFLISVFILGLSTTMSACLFPVLPTFVVYMARAEESRRHGFSAAGAVTLGIVTSFLFFGLIASIIGNFLITNYSSLNMGLGIIIMILGLIMLSPLKHKFAQFSTARVEPVLKMKGTQGAFLTGIVFAFLAPCRAPALLSVVLLASLGDLLWASINMGFFSLGAGIPFLFVGIFAQKLDRPINDRYTQFLRRWSSTIIGILLLVIGGFLVIQHLGLISSLEVLP